MVFPAKAPCATLEEAKGPLPKKNSNFYYYQKANTNCPYNIIKISIILYFFVLYLYSLKKYLERKITLPLLKKINIYKK
jgi:hypothetical protein